MNRPYIICYMMTSLDGRIDCSMTSSLKGVEEYYKILDQEKFDATLSGRATAEDELALKGEFAPFSKEKVKENSFSKKVDAPLYDVIVDTKGKLLWDNDENYETRHIIITSQQASQEYLKYLDSKNISWIVEGKEKIDLKRACEVLYKEFNIKKLGIVGGSKINTSFLKENLLDEILVLIGAGIDAKKSYPTLFDGLDDNEELIPLTLKEVKKYDSQAVLLSYLVDKK